MSFFRIVDWSGRQRLQREKHELKAPQELSDEEIEAVPAESACLERKSTSKKKCEYGNDFVPILALMFREDFFSALVVSRLFLNHYFISLSHLILLRSDIIHLRLCVMIFHLYRNVRYDGQQRYHCLQYNM